MDKLKKMEKKCRGKIEKERKERKSRGKKEVGRGAKPISPYFFNGSCPIPHPVLDCCYNVIVTSIIDSPTDSHAGSSLLYPDVQSF